MISEKDLAIIFSTLIFLVSLISSVYFIPIVNKIGLYYNCIDLPDFRKKHKEKLTRIGGIAMYLGYLIGFLFLISYSLLFNKQYININIITYFLIGLSSFFLLGLSDDIYQLSPFFKLFIQLLVASYLFSAGLRIENLGISVSFYHYSPIYLSNTLSFLVTILWVVGLTNAMNWLDGLDGLASGVSSISLIGIYLVLIQTGQFSLALISAALCGSCVGLLRFNFYPAKILMGDGGSYLLGSAISIISILGLSYNYNPQSILNNISDSLPIFPLTSLFFCFIPCIDMIYVIFARSISGQSPFYPDRRHFHHQIIDFGLNQRSTVVIFYSFSLLAISFGLSFYNFYNNIGLICLSTIFIILSFIYSINLKKNIDINYKK